MGGEDAVLLHRLSKAGIKNVQSVMIRALKRGSNKSLPNRIMCAVFSHIAWVCWVVNIFSEFGRTRNENTKVKYFRALTDYKEGK